MLMNSKWYNFLKFIAQIALPAVAALIGTLGGIWHWNYTEAIVATISAVDVFLGALLMIDSNQYFKDKIIVAKISSSPEDFVTGLSVSEEEQE